ncbi:thioesterase II family protein [Lonsdalea iberica]|uniref:thioesterase II family protein n=1 Tax=Lonsdalea iberica TaxID=1082703 RepID=UPI000B8CB998|nr:thioesterase domain-containing protein [Lonsdalea iberica]
MTTVEDNIFWSQQGGPIAFELARKMEGYWDTPAYALFISGCMAPDEPIIRSLTGLSDKQFIREMTGTGGTETFLLEQPELLYPFLATLRQDIGLCEKYVSPISEPLRTPIHILWGTEDYLITQKMIDGWRRFFSGNNIAFYPHKGNGFYRHQQSENVINIICEVLTSV